MNSNRIGLGDFRANDKTYRLVNSVLDSGRISYGPLSRQLEEEFSFLHSCEYGVLSNSGTSSLQVALQAMKEIHRWEDGDEVIVPAVTFVATANIVLHNRMKPVFVDVDRDTYNIDPRQIDAAVTGRTRAIIPVHLFGQPANMTYISSIAHSRGLKTIEDSCECVLATHFMDTVGSLGDIGCFSFYMAHILTAGVGGIATCNDPKYASKMRSLVNHGRDGIYISIDDGKKEEAMSRRFRFESVGHSFRITELEAALALAQIEDLAYMVARRQENAEFLSNHLVMLEDEIQLPYTESGNSHSFMMYPIVMKNGNKWDLCRHLEDSGIETREMLPLINQPVYMDMIDTGKFPVAEWINRNGFYIGCHQGLTFDDMYKVAEVILDYFGAL